MKVWYSDIHHFNQEIEDLINRAKKEGINICVDTRPTYAKDYDMIAENDYWKIEKKKHV